MSEHTPGPWMDLVKMGRSNLIHAKVSQARTTLCGLGKIRGAFGHVTYPQQVECSRCRAAIAKAEGES